LTKHNPKVLLADLTYTGPNEYMYPYPLGAGYLGAYLKSKYEDIDVELYKDPNDLIKALDDPKGYDILALTNYFWNFNLNRQFLKRSKKKNPKVVTIMGGPNIDSYSDNALRDFFLSMPDLDFYVLGEGEYKFGMLVDALINKEMIKSHVWEEIPLSIVGLENDHINKGSIADPPSCDLATLPSPYLTGLMGKFLDNPMFIPSIETSRGCSFSCTYCCWGKGSKTNKFPINTVYQEIEYITKRTKTLLNAIYLADANFGMRKRDVEIAQRLRDNDTQYGFPKKTYIYFTSEFNETVLKIAGILKEHTSISLSKQTTNPEALKIVKRHNIPDDKYDEAIEMIRKMGGSTFCELIYGLPGESYQSFINGLESIAKKEIHPAIYPLLLLKGSEMNSESFRKQYSIQTAHRIFTKYVGTYGDINSAEYEEIVISHEKCTIEDFFKLRAVHLFLIIFTDDIFADMRRFLNKKSSNYVSFTMFLFHNRESWPVSLESYVEEFEDNVRSELLTKKEVKADFNKEEIEQIKKGAYALNILYFCIFVTNESALKSFREYLSSVLGKFLKEERASFNVEEIAFIIKCCFDKIPEFNRFQPFVDTEYQYDLNAWLADTADFPLSSYKSAAPLRYRLEFRKDLIPILSKMIYQYKERKMALYHFRMNAVTDRSKVMGYTKRRV